MTQYILRRIAVSLLVLWVIVTVTFFLMRIIPGGPFQGEKKLPPEIRKNIEERYKLNDPLLKQYGDYLTNLIHWDLGPSFKYKGQTVNDIIEKGFPISAALGGIAIMISLLVGIPAGIISALRQGRWPDYLAMFFSTIGISVPSFILATLLMYFISYKLHLLPSALWGSPKHVIMPAIALSGLPTAFIARLMRSSMLEVLGQDYIKTARAKGLPKIVIIYRHTIKNAIIPVVTYLGPLTAAILTGSFVVENIFAIPGLGKHFVTSIYNRDYTVIMGVTVFYSILLVTLNLLVDLAYAVIDPRIKLFEAKE
ncbi:MAG: ABC-type transporter, integral rane subunit [Clostridiales bacterium]|nr:ABC-type transporter, integral rane subunit [Clostridiales bacterium]